MKDKRIILIGAGNVAHHLAPALLKAGLNLCQIYSRSIESARELGRKTGITYTADLFGIYPDGDIYIFCVSDDALLSLFKSIRINKEAIILHTSGSLPTSSSTCRKSATARKFPPKLSTCAVCWMLCA